ncbi:MAG: OmpA family protein [Candidatus Eisenbacteria bacterium]
MGTVFFALHGCSSGRRRPGRRRHRAGDRRPAARRLPARRDEHLGRIRTVRFAGSTRPCPTQRRARSRTISSRAIAAKRGDRPSTERRAAPRSARRDAQEQASVRVVCIGLCDGQGEAVNAQNLGMNRAQAAKQFLTGQGIAKDRIETASFASTQATASKDETIGQAEERRVEIWLLGVRSPALHVTERVGRMPQRRTSTRSVEPCLGPVSDCFPSDTVARTQ